MNLSKQIDEIFMLDGKVIISDDTKSQLLKAFHTELLRVIDLDDFEYDDEHYQITPTIFKLAKYQRKRIDLIMSKVGELDG